MDGMMVWIRAVLTWVGSARALRPPSGPAWLEACSRRSKSATMPAAAASAAAALSAALLAAAPAADESPSVQVLTVQGSAGARSA